jgi:tetratricopeptide (TPR) repeat protein
MIRINKFALIAVIFSILSGWLAADEIETSAQELLNHADEVFKSRDYGAALEIYIEAAQSAEKEGNFSMLTEANAMAARTYLIKGQKDEGYIYLTRAVATADTSMPLGWSRYLGVRGRFERWNKDLVKATMTFREMYRYCVAHELHERAIDAAHMVAITGTYDEQVEWAHRAITEAETHGITSWLGPLWNNLGATYEELGEFDKSIEAYINAREEHYKYGDEINKLIADWAVGHAYRLAGEYEEAEKWLKPLPEWCERIGEVEFLGWSFNELGEIELARKNYLPAANCFREAVRNLKAAGMNEWDLAGYQELVRKLEETKKMID